MEPAAHELFEVLAKNLFPQTQVVLTVLGVDCYMNCRAGVFIWEGQRGLSRDMKATFTTNLPIADVSDFLPAAYG